MPKFRSHRAELNNAYPAAKAASLGDVIYDLIGTVNDLRAANAALMAKLDAAGVTVTGLGTNYASTITLPAAVKLPEDRRGGGA